MFLYVTVSTLKPMVGMVEMTSPTCRRYRMVVFPACASRSGRTQGQDSRSLTKKRTGFEKDAPQHHCKFSSMMLSQAVFTDASQFVFSRGEASTAQDHAQYRIQHVQHRCHNRHNSSCCREHIPTMMRTGIVQTQHQDTRFSVTEYTEQLRKPDAHDFWTTRALWRRIQVGDAQMSREKRLCVDRAPGGTPPDCCKQHSPSCLSSTQRLYTPTPTMTTEG